jgi:hypothetical protein
MSNPQAAPPIPSATIPLAKILNVISVAVPLRLQLSTLNHRLSTVPGQSPDATSKNMAVLRNAGIVTQGRGRLYSLAPQFIADKTERILDFGYCLLRMNVPSKQ